MRSLGLTILVLGALLAGFAVIIYFQSDSSNSAAPRVAGTAAPTSPRTVPPPPSTNRTGDTIMGAGEDVWIQQFDPASGRLTNEFRAAHYDPPKDGVVHVDKPESRVFSKNGQVMVVAGRDGEVVMPEQAKKSNKIGEFEGGPPTRGTLNDVTISIFDTADSKTPSLVCKVPMLKFDNDASRVSTDTTEIDGKTLRADEVPVEVRGRDYDFDGTGLTMRWNERDQRLELLEIAHGKRLLVKNLAAFGGMPMSKASPVENDESPIMLVSTAEEDAAKLAAEARERRRQRAAATQRAAAATQKAPKPPREPVAYLATFYDNVTISQLDKQVGQADRMLARFTFEGDDEAATDTAAAKPASRATPSEPKPKSAAEAKTASKKPTEGPIEIKWTGKLNVVPIKYEDSGLRSPKDHEVEFIGSPVRLQREGSFVEAPSVSAGADGNRFAARNNEQFPIVTVVDPSGTKLIAPKIEMADDVITITGNSRADMVMTDDQNQVQKVAATWKDKGTLHTRKLADGRTAIDTAELEGNVAVDHPQMKLNGDSLAMAFATDGDQPQAELKSVSVNGNVRAVITGDDKETQTVTGQSLYLGTAKQPDGKMALTQFQASGKAVIQDSKQTLAADDIDASFKPIIADKKTKPGLPQIERLVATGNVIFNGENSTIAKADAMNIETRDGVQQLTLLGTPAVLSDPQNRLTGKILKLNPDGSGASVPGPGTLSGVYSAGKSKGAEPISVTWTDSFDYDGVKNVADAVGNVAVQSRGSDGDVETATGRRMHVTFAEITDASDTPKANGLVGGKKNQWKTISLQDNVEISSILVDSVDTSKLLRRVHVWVPVVNITSGANGGAGQVEVPAGGRMLYDNRESSNAEKNQAPGMSGATGIEWKKSMIYDPEKNQAVIDGDVVVVHQQGTDEPVRMLTEKLIAEFTSAADGKTQQQLKQVRAGGGATFISPQVRFDAADARYDPITNRIIAAGAENQPVQVFDTSGASSGSFEEVWWNLKTNRPERLRGVSGSVAR